MYCVYIYILIYCIYILIYSIPVQHTGIPVNILMYGHTAYQYTRTSLVAHDVPKRNCVRCCVYSLNIGGSGDARDDARDAVMTAMPVATA